MTAFAFPAVATSLAIYALLMLVLFGAAMVRALAWRRRARAPAARLPEIREALADYLAGGNVLPRLRSLVGNNLDGLADAIMSFQGTVAGGARDRLCGLALQLELGHQWIGGAHSRDPVRRRAAYAGMAYVSANGSCRLAIGDVLWLALNDSDPEVRLSAARGIAQSGFGAETESIFNSALSDSPLFRILLAEALRRHALPLSQAAIPAALRSSDSSRVLAALEILVSWERCIPFDDLHGLLEHPDRRIRLQVLKVAPRFRRMLEIGALS